ncbi:acyloxyacyl hydrolase [Pelosinus propionicus]|uniref:Lipid A 3-O-deacylase (PagL) n=1 Tax=Pelosinus propionicus DSM 13327 TaxID=1123291 RepID=A0A1I4PII5_9FIRM|nr:acyloxyacyl hydrolase [Pelosinus propionicus]SFM27400.1 Lipid A 3-O-deacylase (PagL) [Pelosinus propionicus DSM 13327]
MRRLICFVIVINFLLIFIPGKSYCYAADPKFELEWDYLTPFTSNRDIDTVSLHIITKISEKNNKSVYRGFTITRPYGSIDLKKANQDSSAVGVGPIYMIRSEKEISGKLSAALDMSGGFIVYDKIFPAGGRYYNFMWRVGPQFIYKTSKDSSVNMGYMLMHVSNGGLGGHNPSYNAHGVSFSFVTKF